MIAKLPTGVFISFKVYTSISDSPRFEELRNRKHNTEKDAESANY